VGVAWTCDDVSPDAGEICEAGVPAGEADTDDWESVAIGDAVTDGLEIGAGLAEDVTSFDCGDAAASRDRELAS